MSTITSTSAEPAMNGGLDRMRRASDWPSAGAGPPRARRVEADALDLSLALVGRIADALCLLIARSSLMTALAAAGR